MKTDTTLFEIYSELGILEIMQSAESEQYIAAVCNEISIDDFQAA